MDTSQITLTKNTIRYMLKFVEGYEQIKAKKHHKFKTSRAYFAANGICFQNFYKFYSRYISSGRDEQKLLPLRRGPKPKYLEMPLTDDSLEKKILEYRKQGFDKYTIEICLRKENSGKKVCSVSTIYRVLRSLGESRLTKKMTEEKRKIVKERVGQLAHVDCHYLPKGVVASEPNSRYFALGVIDDYSRVVWVEVMKSTKSLDATFAMMDAMLIMNNRYGIKIEEVLTDNGSEFCSDGEKKEDHPFERLLLHFAIGHRRTKPYRPQTNGKIERFWRSFHDEVIEGSVFASLDELKDAVLGYNFYHNECRPHQGINGKKPVETLDVIFDNDQAKESSNF